jgi:hypothetical protein
MSDILRVFTDPTGLLLFSGFVFWLIPAALVLVLSPSFNWDSLTNDEQKHATVDDSFRQIDTILAYVLIVFCVLFVGYGIVVSLMTWTKTGSNHMWWLIPSAVVFLGITLLVAIARATYVNYSLSCCDELKQKNWINVGVIGGYTLVISLYLLYSVYSKKK